MENNTFEPRVLNYLELVNIKNNKQALWLINNFDLQIDNFSDFYSQPFKPEMITELFEGWKIINYNKYWVDFFNTDNDNYISIRNDFKLIEYHIDMLNNYVFLYPRTLNDFINDCQRAGIELKWRNNNGK